MMKNLGWNVLLAIGCLVVMAACGVPQIRPTATPKVTPTRFRPTETVSNVVPSEEDIFVELVYMNDRDKRNFNPYHFEARYEAIDLIFEKLMYFDSEQGEAIPWLAERYAWGDDNRSLTFWLRKDVLWSDGMPFTAQDVVFTYEMLQQHPKITGIPDVYLLPVSLWLSEHVDRVEMVDDFQVTFRFRYADTLGLYEIIGCFILPKHQWEAYSQNLAQFKNPVPVGTGPFTEVTAVEPLYIQVERNPHYWQAGKPAIQGVRLQKQTEPKEDLKALFAGEIDMAFLSEPDLETEYEGIDPANFHVIGTERFRSQLLFNTAHAPLDRKEVRQALAMAIDRERMVQQMDDSGFGLLDISGIGDLYPGWEIIETNRKVAWEGYDPNKANDLLDAIGMPIGPGGVRYAQGKALNLTFLVGTNSPTYEKVAQVVADCWKEIGVGVTVKALENWYELEEQGAYDVIFSAAWSENTPYEYYQTLLGGDGLVNWNGYGKTNRETGRFFSQQADELLAAFRTEADFEKQKEIVWQLRDIFYEDVPAVPLYSERVYYEYSTRRFVGFPPADEDRLIFYPYRLPMLVNLVPR